MSLVSTSLIVVTVALASVACSKSADTTQTQKSKTTTAPVATGEDAHDLFKSRCAPCHGEHGKGDGPGAAALNPKPRNYTDVAWQDKTKDEDIKKTILYGGAAVGKSPQMPANPDLEGKPELDELVKVVREFKGK